RALAGHLPEPVPEQDAERPVGQRLAVGDAAALEPERLATGGRLPELEPAPELGREARLTDPSLADHEQDAPRAGEGGLDRLDAQAELLLATDELGADRPARLVAALRHRPQRAPRADPLGLSLQPEP